MEKKKMGRPTSDPKIHETRIRMSDNDLKKLEYCVKKTGKSKADLIRMGIENIFTELSK